MSDNCVNYLEDVNSKPELVKEINALINEYDFRAYDSNDNYWSERSYAAKKIAKAFEKLSHSYNISKESIIFYYSMDKKIFPKTGYYELTSPRFELFFRGFDNSFHLDGQSLMRAFRENVREAIEFCFNHYKLFPDSSRKYIEKQKDKMEGIMEATKISNKFQSKTLKYSLSDAFNFTQLSRNINSFGSLKDTKELASSLLNFYNIINEKYTNGADRDQLLKLNSRIFVKIYNIFKGCFSEANIKENDRQILSLILEYIKEDEFALDYIFDKLTNNPAHINKRVFFFSYSLTKNKELITKLDDCLLRNIELEARNTSFAFSILSKDTKSAVLKDIKESWDKKFRIKYFGLYI